MGELGLGSAFAAPCANCGHVAGDGWGDHAVFDDGREYPSLESCQCCTLERTACPTGLTAGIVEWGGFRGGMQFGQPDLVEIVASGTDGLNPGGLHPSGKVKVPYSDKGSRGQTTPKMRRPMGRTPPVHGSPRPNCS